MKSIIEKAADFVFLPAPTTPPFTLFSTFEDKSE
jgi:hypothetical protein